ncbi:MAG TPA: tetratricopeptide repeat protein, partial [Nitrospiria bacterium]|nr:tetratricopeptide repeat protein [Nitrospiria bacterium]
LFYLLSLLAYIQGRTEAGSRSYLWFGISAVAAFLALETKENAVTLPVTMLLYDLFFINRFNLQISRKQWTIFSLVLLMFLGGLLFVIQTFKGSGTLYSMLTAQYGTEEMDPLLRTMSEWRVLLYYLFLMIFPLPSFQTLDYEFPFSNSLFDPLTTFLSLSAILLMIGFSIKKARQFPLISFAILWYFINQVIESTFIKLDLVFEHRLYLPSVFLFLFIGVLVFNFFSKRFQKPEIVFVICGILISIVLAGLTYERNKVWKSSISLWSDVVAKAPNKSRAWNNLGKAYLEENRFDEASGSFEKAARLDNNNQEAINNLGNALQREGKFELAIKLYQGLLANNPRNPLAHNDIGVAYEALYERDVAANNIKKANEEIVAAQKEFIEAINIDPYYTDAHNNLGNIYYMSKQPDQAIVEYRKVIELNPKHPMAHTNLGMVLATKGELDAARQELELSMQINPAVMVTHINYGMLLEKAGKLNEALVHYRDAIRWAAPQEAEKVRQVKDEISKIEAVMKDAGR